MASRIPSDDVHFSNGSTTHIKHKLIRAVVKRNFELGDRLMEELAQASSTDHAEVRRIYAVVKRWPWVIRYRHWFEHALLPEEYPHCSLKRRISRT